MDLGFLYKVTVLVELLPRNKEEIGVNLEGVCRDGGNCSWGSVDPPGSACRCRQRLVDVDLRAVRGDRKDGCRLLDLEHVDVSLFAGLMD